MRYCGRCGNPLQNHSLTRERRNVTVVFVDLAGFSSMTREFDPEKLRDLADEVLTVVAGVIEDFDGYVDAFQGDGLIALFGAPHSHADDPERAVRAASASLRAIEAVGESKGITLKGRAGVNTGVVIAGAVGSGRVREYTVMGSAVNLAARLESAASTGEVFVGPDTCKATRHCMIYRSVSPVSLQGFPNITEVFSLVSFAEDHEDDPYSKLSFIGRDKQRTRLRERFTEVLEQCKAKTLWLTGDAGIGKTRLAREFLKELEADERVRVVWIEEQSLDTEAMWRQLVRQIFELESEDNKAWLQIMKHHLDIWLPNEPRWQNYILRSVGLLDDNNWRRLERRTVDRAFLAWRDLLKAVARNEHKKGLVMVVEHSSQGSSFGQFLDLFEGLEVPIFILRTSRGRDMPHESQTPAEEMVLPPLELEERIALIDQLANPILKVATNSLVFQVGGVPANILELGRALNITPQGSFSGSLASLLQSRLDMLSTTSRQLLAYAALTGERSWEGLILELAGADSATALEEIITAGLLTKEASSVIENESEYRFQSELLRRAVLRMIPFTERPLLHLKIATWLESHAPLALSALIGRHFKEGQSHEAAYPHFLAAADLAISEQDAEQAYRYFADLLALELPPYLLAQGALACAQAALSQSEDDFALENLNTADEWIELCEESYKLELRQVHKQLYAELSPEA